MAATTGDRAEAITAIRLLPRHPRPGSAQAADVRTLLDLGERERRRAAEGELVAGLVASAERALAELPPLVGQRLDGIATLTVELAMQVAREIVGAALDQGRFDPTPVVARCLRDCVHGASPSDLVVRLHPDDLELVRQRLQQARELEEEVAAARFVADPTLARGAVRAETETGRLRYDPREALERVAAEIRREATT